MSETKKCKTCGEEKELSEFYWDKRTRADGKEYKYPRSPCKKCKPSWFNYRTEAGQKRYKAYRETAISNQRRYRSERKESGVYSEKFRKYKLGKIRRNAKEKGLDFDLTLEDIVIPDKCPVLGIKFNPSDISGFSPMNRKLPSVDRFDNNKGYTKDNIRIISLRANALKSDASFEEIEALYNWMKKELGKE